MRRLIRFGLLALAGCQSYAEGPYPIENSTWLLDEPAVADNAKADVTVRVLADRTACDNASMIEDEDIDLCVPQVDRGHGQVRYSFYLDGTKGDGPQFLSLQQSQIELAYFGTENKQDPWELVPHDPRGASQLFILIIDGSASIYKTGGIKKVREALLHKDVVNAFLPKDRSEGKYNGVLLLRFSEGLQTIDGKDPFKEAKILERQKDYVAYVSDHLENRGKAGYSHVYEAVTKSATTLIETETIRNFIGAASAEPTIVLLTDGFNNIENKDVCADNVPRLKESLATIERAVAKGGKSRMRVFTIGLGKALNPDFEPPRGGTETINPTVLCSNETSGYYGEQQIDGHLELQGIDSQSLFYLAQAGNGESWVRKDAKGLAEVFLKTAAQKFEWYTLYTQINPYWHRRSFDIRMRLKGGIQGETTVVFHPSPWLDAPTGVITEGDTWFTTRPFRDSLAPLLVIIGGLLSFGYVGAAWFNARRAITRRPRA